MSARAVFGDSVAMVGKCHSCRFSVGIAAGLGCDKDKFSSGPVAVRPDWSCRQYVYAPGSLL